MLNKKEVRKFIYDLMSDGKNCITKLSDEEKEVATAMIIEGSDKFSANEYVSEADTTCDLPHLLAKYMAYRDSESAQDLLDTMVSNAVKYAGNTIVDLIIEQEEEYNFNNKYDGEC